MIYLQHICDSLYTSTTLNSRPTLSCVRQCTSCTGCTWLSHTLWHSDWVSVRLSAVGHLHFRHRASASTTWSTSVTSLKRLAWFSLIRLGSPPLSERNNSMSSTILLEFLAKCMEVWCNFTFVPAKPTWKWRTHAQCGFSFWLQKGGYHYFKWPPPQKKKPIVNLVFNIVVYSLTRCSCPSKIQVIVNIPISQNWRFF